MANTTATDNAEFERLRRTDSTVLVRGCSWCGDPVAEDQQHPLWDDMHAGCGEAWLRYERMCDMADDGRDPLEDED